MDRKRMIDRAETRYHRACLDARRAEDDGEALAGLLGGVGDEEREYALGEARRFRDAAMEYRMIFNKMSHAYAAVIWFAVGGDLWSARGVRDWVIELARDCDEGELDYAWGAAMMVRALERFRGVGAA